MNGGLAAGLTGGASPDVLVGDAGQNALLVGGTRREYKFSSTTTGVVFGPIDTTGYQLIVVHVTGAPGAFQLTAQFQQSHSTDPATFIGANFYEDGAANLGPASILPGTAASSRVYFAPVRGRYFRINVTSTNGTAFAGVVELLSVAPPLHQSSVYVANSIQVSGASSSGSDSLATSGSALGVQSLGYRYNGASWDRLRVPTLTKTATATASGDTALWTPASGKKVRLLRYLIQVTSDVATTGGGVIDVVLRDGTTATAAAFSFYAPAASAGTSGAGPSSGWVDLGNGLLSATANTVLNGNLSAALTAGKVRFVLCGTEE